VQQLLLVAYFAFVTFVAFEAFVTLDCTKDNLKTCSKVASKLAFKSIVEHFQN
jgi:hypothetical protein